MFNECFRIFASLAPPLGSLFIIELSFLLDWRSRTEIQDENEANGGEDEEAKTKAESKWSVLPTARDSK